MTQEKQSYYGHPSWKHWNIITEVGNREHLYNSIFTSSKRSWTQYVTGKTLGGVKVTASLANYAYNYWKEDD